MSIVTLLEKLINKKFYKKEEIQNKLNVFYAMSKITDEEYSNLTLRVEEVYVVVEEVIEETTEEVLNESTSE